MAPDSEVSSPTLATHYSAAAVNKVQNTLSGGQLDQRYDVIFVHFDLYAPAPLMGQVRLVRLYAR